MFKIITDSTADLSKKYMEEKNIGCLHLSVIIDGVTYGPKKALDNKEFYDMLRSGKMPTTSQVNPAEVKNILLDEIKDNKELLIITFSSGLSGTFNSIRLAAEEIVEDNDDVKIKVVDSLSASLGEGLLVYKAQILKEQGKSLDEIYDWLEKNKHNLVHAFTVDDLFHLYRGGRVNKSAAILGSIAGIKPMLNVDDEGHLSVTGKVRGRKKSLSSLVDTIEEKQGTFKGQNDIIFISHGDAYEDAVSVSEMIKEKYGIDNFVIEPIGPEIGSHAGAGTIALFFFGDNR